MIFQQQPDALNLDTYRPNDGMDDIYQPTTEGINDLDADLDLPTSKTQITYDELRKKNREKYNGMEQR